MKNKKLCDQGGLKEFSFVDLDIARLRRTTLTGVIEKERLASIKDLDVEPMSLEAVKVTF